MCAKFVTWWQVEGGTGLVSQSPRTLQDLTSPQKNDPFLSNLQPEQERGIREADKWAYELGFHTYL